jgi:hypothetical protein
MTDKTLKDKAIDIKGKKYAQVKDRVQWLDENMNGKYSITTDYKYYETQRMWVVKAQLSIFEEGRVLDYNGLAQEVESDDFNKVNNASALENCETSAIGRACAAFGLGIQESYASANEMNKQPRAMKLATPKQIKWIRDTARQLNDQLGDDAEVDEFIESILTIKPTQIPVFKIKDAIDKLKLEAGNTPDIDYEGGAPVEVTDEMLEKVQRGEIDY